MPKVAKSKSQIICYITNISEVKFEDQNRSNLDNEQINEELKQAEDDSKQRDKTKQLIKDYKKVGDELQIKEIKNEVRMQLGWSSYSQIDEQDVISRLQDFKLNENKIEGNSSNEHSQHLATFPSYIQPDFIFRA
jgi:peptide methionine sulfoxide reductase MsrB